MLCSSAVIVAITALIFPFHHRWNRSAAHRKAWAMSGAIVQLNVISKRMLTLREAAQDNLFSS
jgi:hypothetical protein